MSGSNEKGALTRRASLMMIGAGAALAARISVNSAYAASPDDEPILSEAAVLRDPNVPATGNLQGDVTIAGWSDYQCPYCRRADPELRQLVQRDGKIRLVMKDWPILGPISVTAARMALASKFQDKYLAAHDAMIGAKSRLTEPRISELLANAGIDMDRLKGDLAAQGKQIDAILARNNDQAAALGFSGTPAFIVGHFRVPGMLSMAEFEQAIADARKQSSR